MRRRILRGCYGIFLVALLVQPVAVLSKVVTRPVTIFALLANSHLLVMDGRSGHIRRDLALAPSPVDTNLLGTGQYLARSPDGHQLVVLVPVDIHGMSEVTIVDLISLTVRAQYHLPRGLVLSSLAVGAKTGHLYLFGNRRDRSDTRFGSAEGGVGEAAVVLVLDPLHGTVLADWTARPTAGRDWYVLQGLVSLDEHRIFISYHGTDTSGIDWFTPVGGHLERCQITVPASSGCLRTHGGIAFYGNDVLATTGEGPIEEVDISGTVRRRFDTQLPGNHLMDFALDRQARRLYVVGPCGYAGGFSVIDLRTGSTRVLVPPAPPSTQGAMSEPGLLCGEQPSLDPPGLLVVGKTARTVPVLGLPGKFLFLDTGTGRVVHAVKVAAEPLDVLALG
jgi:hypothetical protein